VPYPTFSLSARGILEKVLVYFYGVCGGFVLSGEILRYRRTVSTASKCIARNVALGKCLRLFANQISVFSSHFMMSYVSPRSPPSCALAKLPKDAAENYQLGAPSHAAETDALPPKL